MDGGLKRAHNPKVAGSKPAPATMGDEGLADAAAASPFRLPRLHPGIGSTTALLSCRSVGECRHRTGRRETSRWMSFAGEYRRHRGDGVVTRPLRSCGSRRRASGSANIDLVCDLNYHEVLSHLHRSRVVLSRRWYQILFARVGLKDV